MFQFQFLEFLEARQLMSIVNVTDYGAQPGDGRDDAPAVRSAIDDSHEGDVVFFPGGTYIFRSAVTLAGNRTYRGDAPHTIIKNDGTIHVFDIHEDNATVENLTFYGKGIFIDHGGNQMVSNVTINNNIFHVHATGDHSNGITFTTGLANSHISNNTFDRIEGDNGIYGYNWSNLRISNNQFLNGQEGIHLIDFTNASDHLIIQQNYFSGLSRMGVEIQGGGNRTIVQDNFYEHPAMTRNPDDNMSTFAYSIIADRSKNTIVRRNTSIAPQRPDGSGVRIIFELGGRNVQCYDNYSIGGHQVAILNTSRDGVIRDNRFSDYMIGADSYPGRSPGAVVDNNDNDVELTWDINRGRPGPNRAFGGSGLSAPKPLKIPRLLDSDHWVYLTDLPAVAANSSWGPVEVDQSNGGRLRDDGAMIQLDGKRYPRGLGVAVDSSVSYNLDGNYTKFFSDIGIDDSTRNLGSMSFQIWADGTMLFDSGTITAKDGRKSMSLFVKGVRKLKLVTTNGGDNDHYDLGDWAAPRLVTA